MPTATREVRQYQVEAKNALEYAYGAYDDTILCLPTGSGKTWTAVDWLLDLQQRIGAYIIWAAERKELCRQAYDEFLNVIGILGLDTRVTRWNRHEKDASGDVVIAQIQSSRTLHDSLREKPAILVFDEVHHSAADSWVGLRNRVDAAWVMGLTATAHRLDGKELPFSNICYQKTLQELVNDGYLARPTYIRYRTNQEVNFRRERGDFSRKSMRSLDNLDRNGMVAREYAEHITKYKKVIVFAVDVEHAKNLVKAITAEVADMSVSGWQGYINVDGEEELMAAHVMYGDMDNSERDSRMRQFVESKYGVIVNVGLFTEGLDVPDIGAVFLARPTASKVLFMQMIGRGTRKVECRECKGSGKPPDPEVIGNTRDGSIAAASACEPINCGTCGGSGFEKDSFFIVDFIDLADHYASAVEQWSLDELGADADPELEERRTSKDGKAKRFKALHDWAEEMQFSITKKHEREILQVDGVVTVSNPWKKNHRIIVTKQMRQALEAMYYLVIHADRRKIKQRIEEGYRETVLHNEISRRRWTTIAWSMYRKFVQRVDFIQGGTTFNYRKLEVL